MSQAVTRADVIPPWLDLTDVLGFGERQVRKEGHIHTIAGIKLFLMQKLWLFLSEMDGRTRKKSLLYLAFPLTSNSIRLFFSVCHLYLISVYCVIFFLIVAESSPENNLWFRAYCKYTHVPMKICTVHSYWPGFEFKVKLCILTGCLVSEPWV